MQTVAELPEFIRTADKLLSLVERQDLIRYLALHPKAGDLMEGTGGVRKLRWRRGDHGKSGGVRVIYYVYDEHNKALVPAAARAKAEEARKLIVAGKIKVPIQ